MGMQWYEMGAAESLLMGYYLRERQVASWHYIVTSSSANSFCTCHNIIARHRRSFGEDSVHI
jgi:hypothetical protein